MNKIEEQLNQIFKTERIVIWIDEKAEMTEEFNALSLPGVEKIQVSNNEFSIKYRIIKTEPDKKFLLYFKDKQPKDTENWLLDIILANRVFYSDKTSIILDDLGLKPELKETVAKHESFFSNQERTAKLKKMLKGSDNVQFLLYKMIASVCSSEPNLNDILFSLFTELANKDDSKFRTLEKYNLLPFFWSEVNRAFGYSQNSPLLKDLLINIFNKNYLEGETTSLSTEAVVFFNHWKDSKKNADSFRKHSEALERELNIHASLEEVEYHRLIHLDIFKAIDYKIISDLVTALNSNDYSSSEISSVINQRRSRFWYNEFSNIYDAILTAVEFIDLSHKCKYEFSSMEEAFSQYTESLYKMDTLYRKYILYYKKAFQNNILSPLYDKVEKIYSNQFLLNLNDKFQQLIDSKDNWEIKGFKYQREFFNSMVKPYLDKGHKLFVIISDAFRYECGAEFTALLNNEQRTRAELNFVYSTIPSYTQLGMAALLPNKEITYDDNGGVYVDGQSSQGTENRDKILKQNIPTSTAITAEDFLSMSSNTDGRDFVKQYSLIYIYSNGIDSIGDSEKTESQVFSAVEDEFEKIKKLIKHIYNVNGTHVLITSDHGFLYQDSQLDEGSFIIPEKLLIEVKDQSFKYNRRFVLGRQLKSSSSFKKYNGKQANIDDEIEVLVPKSINRLKVKGAGSRYVHGGATLQEITIPVIKVVYRRSEKIDFVNIDILGKPEKITSAQITLKFYQEDPIEDKVLPRTLKIGFYNQNNSLISNQENVIFDSVDPSGNNRTKQIKFIFSKDIDKENNKNIVLKLEEPISNSNQFKPYKKFTFKVQKTFIQDFDL